MIQVNRIYLIFNRLVTKKFLVDTSVVFCITKMGRKSGKNWEKNSIFGNEKKSIFENGCCGSSPMNFCLQ